MDEEFEDEEQRLPSLWLPLATMVLTAALCVIVWLRLVPLGIPGEWVWQYVPAPEPRRLALAGLCFFAAGYFGFAVWRGIREGRAGALLVVLGLLASGALTRVGVVGLRPGWGAEVTSVVLSDVATSYYGEALRLENPREYVRRYAGMMGGLPYHLQTHPPGAVVLMWLARRGVDTFPVFSRRVAGWTLGSPPGALAEDLGRVTGKRGLDAGDVTGALWVAVLLAVAGWLTCLPAYWLGSQLFDDECGFLAGMLVGFVPSVLVFMPTLDQFVMLVGVFGLACLAWGLRRGGGESLLAPGLVCGVGVLVTFGLAAAAGIIGLSTLFYRLYVRQRHWWARVLLDWLFILLGVGLPSLAVYAFTGGNVLAILKNAMQAHHLVVTEWWSRTYSYWVVGNLVDFGVMLGLPVIALAFSAARARWRGAQEDTAAVWAITLAYVVVVAALDLSGSVRAEVSRIWLFLTPVPLVLAGKALAVQGERRGWVVACLVACQGLQALVFAASARFVSPY